MSTRAHDAWAKERMTLILDTPPRKIQEMRLMLHHLKHWWEETTEIIECEKQRDPDFRGLSEHAEPLFEAARVIFGRPSVPDGPKGKTLSKKEAMSLFDVGDDPLSRECEDKIQDAIRREDLRRTKGRNQKKRGAKKK